MAETAKEAEQLLLLPFNVDAKTFHPFPNQTDMNLVKTKLVSEIKQCIENEESVEWSVVLLSSVLNLVSVKDDVHGQLQQLLLHSYSNRWCMDGRAAYYLYHLWYSQTPTDHKAMIFKVELFMALAVRSAFKEKGI